MMNASGKLTDHTRRTRPAARPRCRTGWPCSSFSASSWGGLPIRPTTCSLPARGLGRGPTHGWTAMRKINGKLFLTLLIGVVVLTGGVFAVHHFQYQRIARALLFQARRADESNQ